MRSNDPSSEQGVPRYALIREDERVALWHFHRTMAEFVGWLPVPVPEEEAQHLIDIHGKGCRQNTSRDVIESSLGR